MLARTFKSADELGISHDEVSALITVLDMMERGEIRDHGPHSYRKTGEKGNPKILYMVTFFNPNTCGTAACVAGWAHHVSNGKAFPELGPELAAIKGDTSVPSHHRYDSIGDLYDRLSEPLRELFKFNATIYSTGNPPVAEVQIALRKFLTTGSPR